ncbi:MAG: hypothetical protein QXY40_00080 [Candidatus Methanomethylicia archaeon]
MGAEAISVAGEYEVLLSDALIEEYENRNNKAKEGIVEISWVIQS